jgi:uncharacterized cupredoxin-like copper-binding protein
MHTDQYCHFLTKPRVVIGSPANILTFVAAFLMLHGGAHAHGDKHAPAAKFDYAKAEQMPFGVAADPKKAARTMRIEMADTMRYTPSEVRVKRGETVRFVITNKGKVMHEMVLGTMDELKKHAELMKKHPGMEHDEPHMAHVAPGKTGEMGWRFTKPGTFYYGCLIPGHFEAGMIGKVVVE